MRLLEVERAVRIIYLNKTCYDCCDDLTRRGIKFMLSNSDTEFIRDLYVAYNIIQVKAKRAVNSVASKRGDVNELVIGNYE